MSISAECDRLGQHDDCDGKRCSCGCHPRRKYPNRTAEYAMTHLSPASWRAELNGTDDSEDVT